MKIELAEESSYRPSTETLLLKTKQGETLEVNLEQAAAIVWDLLDALSFPYNEMEDLQNKIDKELEKRGCL